MIKITLPKKHEDGFTIKYWEVSLSESWVFLAEGKAVYHLNTKWDSYSKEKGGADLINDWMFSKRELGSKLWHDESRCLGWLTIKKALGYEKDIFETKSEAIAYIKDKYSEAIKEEANKIAEMINLSKKYDKIEEWCPYEVNHFEKNGICNLCGYPKSKHITKREYNKINKVSI